jgi:hypothetical protein
MHHIYLGSFYVRSEVIHKSPDDCVVLHGKILCEVKVHQYEQCVVAVSLVPRPLPRFQCYTQKRGRAWYAYTRTRSHVHVVIMRHATRAKKGRFVKLPVLSYRI